MCGIWAYSGKNFNKYKFNILGIFNDSRGGDSCGLFLSNKKKKQIGYGADKTKLYSEYIASGVELDFENINFALGHARKASVGGIGWAQAQPVVIKDDNDKVKFVMIHNGTITNFRELARKYNVKFEYTETDSQVFARIVYLNGYDVIKEYDGAGAFMFWDSRDGNDTIKVFKGASLYYQFDDELYIERPLFFCMNKGSIYISSIESSLNFINDDNSEVIAVKENTLFTISGGKIIGEDLIDRSKSFGTYPLAHNSKYKPAISYNSTHPWNNSNKYSAGDEWDEYFQNQDESFLGKQYKSLEKKTDQNHINILSSVWTDCIITDFVKGNTPKNRVYFDVCGLYMLDGNLCDGIMALTNAGYTVIDTKSANYSSWKTYYFIEGVLMNSYFDYLCAREFCKLNFPGDGAFEIEPVFLAKYSATPVPMTYVDPKTGCEYLTFYKSSGGDDIEFNGVMEPYFTFTKTKYRVKCGEIEWYTKTSEKKIFEQPVDEAIFDNEIRSGKISKEELDELIKKNL